MSTKIKPNEGDWICQGKTASGVCGNVNFASRQKCNKCGCDAQREWIYKKTGIEIGKQQADKSGGLFSADDWMCKSCGNINWARRVKCNVCNSSKLAKAENRTGLGGGFKDRDDVVEYKERAESDDEYDEFGLKKKKFRGGQVGSSAVGNEHSRSDHASAAGSEADFHGDDDDEGEEEEEEEEDEDEGDLDKYNLLDEDDINDMVEKSSPRERPEPRGRNSSESSSSSYSGSSDESDSGSSSSKSTDDDSDSDSSSSSSSASSRDHRHSKSERKGHHSREERYRSRSRSPVDKNGRRETHQPRR